MKAVLIDRYTSTRPARLTNSVYPAAPARFWSAGVRNVGTPLSGPRTEFLKFLLEVVANLTAPLLRVGP